MQIKVASKIKENNENLNAFKSSEAAVKQITPRSFEQPKYSKTSKSILKEINSDLVSRLPKEFQKFDFSSPVNGMGLGVQHPR